MKTGRLFFTSTVLAFALACASDGIPEPPNGLVHAAAMFMCGPADGPATAILLSSEPAPIESAEPPFPYVRIVIWQPVGHLMGRTWQVINSDTAAAAWYVFGPNSFEQAASGRVAVERVDANYTIDGTADLRFRSRRITGRFSASWLQRAVICG